MKNAPLHDWLMKSAVTLMGDERHDFEWNEEKGSTTANRVDGLIGFFTDEVASHIYQANGMAT